MNDCIKIFQPDSPECARLLSACHEIRGIEPCDPDVETVLFDAGQDWKWTTLTVRAGFSDNRVQVLSPAQQEKLLYGSDDDFKTVIDDVIRTVHGLPDGEPSYRDDKAAFVKTLAVTLRRVPALSKLDIQYGVLRPGDKFVPVYSYDPSIQGVECVRFLMDGHGVEDAKYQSIAGDSLTAVFCDIGRKLAEIMY